MQNNISRLGFRHFHYLTPKPTNYAYPYADFFHAIYAAYANQYDAQAKQHDVFVLDSGFYPIVDLDLFQVASSERFYLDAALGKR